MRALLRPICRLNKVGCSAESFLIHHAQIILRYYITLFCCFGEPVEGLLVIFTIAPTLEIPLSQNQLRRYNAVFGITQDEGCLFY